MRASAQTNGLRELPHAQRDDPAALHQLLFGDDQGRCETDDVAVCGFGEEAIVAQEQAEFPGGLRATVGCGARLDDHGIEQAFAAHEFHIGELKP
jgi:hypothetical protein